MGWQYGKYQLPEVTIPIDFCNPPTELGRTIAGDVVSFFWKKPHDVLFYTIEITEVGVDTVSVDVHGTRYSRKLKPNTNYTWTVKSICSTSPDSQSQPANGPSFTTGDYTTSCPPIDVDDCIVLTFPDKVTISWLNAPAEASFYEVRYKPKTGFFPYKTISTQDKIVEIDFLIANTTYIFTVRPICKDGTPEIPDKEGEFTTPVSERDCPTPVIKTLTASYNTLILVWEYNSMHKRYNIFVNGALRAQNFIGNVFFISDLQVKTSYVITLVAVCEKGNSSPTEKTMSTGMSKCNKVTGLTVVWNNGLDISFDAPTDVYKTLVTVNGSAYDLINVHSLHIDLPSDGTLYKIEATNYCGSSASDIKGISDTVYGSITAPFVCPIITAFDHQVLSANSIFIDWPSYNGVAQWQVRYKKHSDVDSIMVLIDVSQFTMNDLEPDTDYDVTVKAICTDDTDPAYFLLHTTTTPSCPIIVINSVTNITESSAQFNISIPGDPGNGNYKLSLNNGIDPLIEVIFHGNTVVVTGLKPATTYTVVIYNECTGGNVSVSQPQDVTTKRACVPVSDLTAIPDFGLDQVVVSWDITPLSDPYLLDVYLQPAGQTDFTLLVAGLHGVNTYNYNFTGNDVFNAGIVKVVTRDTQTSSTCERSVQVQCPTVINLESEIDGTNASLIWKQIKGVLGYRVHITSLLVKEVYFTEAPTINLKNLDPNTDYSWFVETVCVVGADGPFSDVYTFKTQDATYQDGECAIPQFIAVVEDPNAVPAPAVVKLVFYGVNADGASPAATGPTSIAVDPLGDITINFGNIVMASYYWFMYKASDNGAFKTKWQDMSDFNNAGSIGSVSDAFENRTIVIDSVSYKLTIGRYASLFGGNPNQTVKFFTP